MLEKNRIHYSRSFRIKTALTSVWGIVILIFARSAATCHKGNRFCHNSLLKLKSNALGVNDVVLGHWNDLDL